MRLGDAWERLWFREASLVRLAAFRILVMTLCLADLIAYSRVNLSNCAAVSDGTIAKPWNPIYLFEVLGLGPPGIETGRAVFTVGLVALTLALFGLFTRVACLVSAVVVLYWSGLNYSFSKIHHDKVTLAFVLMALPLAPVGARLSLDAVLTHFWRTRRGGGPPGPAPTTHTLAHVPILLAQLTLSIGYGFSGATKLAVRGLDWGNGYTLMGILMHYSTEWSGLLSRNVELCRFLSFGTLFVQTTFPLVLLFPALRWFYLPSAVLFHLATWKTMDTGPYMTLWFLLIAFLPLERIPGWLRAALWSGSRLRAAFALFVTVAPALLVLRILFFYLPLWTLLLLVPLLWRLVQYLRPRPARPRGSLQPHAAGP